MISNAIIDAQDEINPVIYDQIKDIIIGNHDKDMTDCMVKDLKNGGKVSRFYNPELLKNSTALKTEVTPYLLDAEINCKNEEVATTVKPHLMIVTALVMIINFENIF